MLSNGHTPTIRLVFPSDVDSAVSQAECAELASVAEGLDVLELGAWKGRTTIVLAQAAASLHSVDWHRGDPHAGTGHTLIDYISNLNRYGILSRENFVAHVGRFEQVLPALKPFQFDVVFIDGQHDYETVKRDADMAETLLSPGGTLCFHDYGVDMADFGVTRAVNELYGAPDRVVGSLAVVRR